MNESVGSVSLYNIIFVFIIITFGVLAGILSYSKAFRVSQEVVDALEYYNGYNAESKKEINRVMSGIGYRTNAGNLNRNCPKREGVEAIYTQEEPYFYCVYEICEGTDTECLLVSSGVYYHWGVVTYIYIDIPIIGGLLQLPVYTSSESVYRFPKSFPKPTQP